MTTTTPQYEIRGMTRNEVDTAIEWAAAEGWNPGLHDATCFFAADPDGFLAGLLDDELVATISVVKYGTSFGFLGLYIVKPSYRGRGYGLGLWNAGIAHLEQRSIGSTALSHNRITTEGPVLHSRIGTFDTRVPAARGDARSQQLCRCLRYLSTI